MRTWQQHTDLSEKQVAFIKKQPLYKTVYTARGELRTNFNKSWTAGVSLDHFEGLRSKVC